MCFGERPVEHRTNLVLQGRIQTETLNVRVRLLNICAGRRQAIWQMFIGSRLASLNT